MKRYFEFKDDKSNKFWEIALEGASLTTRYGKIGAQGQTTTKSFSSEAEAKKECDSLIREKTRKGYKELSSGKKAKGEPLNYKESMKAVDKIMEDENSEKFNDALELLERLEWQNSDDSELYFNKGWLLNEMGEFEKALIALQKCLALAEESDLNMKGKALVSVGFAYSHLEQLEKAIEYYNTAFAIDPQKRIQAAINSSICLMQLGKLNEGLEGLQKALSVCSEFCPEKIADIYYNQACVFARLGMNSIALEKLQEAIYKSLIAELDNDYRLDAKQDKDFASLWENGDFQMVCSGKQLKANLVKCVATGKPKDGELGVTLINVCGKNKDSLYLLLNYYKLPTDPNRINSLACEVSFPLNLENFEIIYDKNKWMTGMCKDSKGNLYCVDMDGLLHTNRDGEWTSIKLNCPDGINDVWVSTDDSVFVIGVKGEFIQIVDGKIVKKLKARGGLNAIGGNDSKLVFVVGDDGLILCFDGINLKELPKETNESLLSCCFVSNEEIYFGGVNGVLLKWNGKKYHWMVAPFIDVHGIAVYQDKLYAATGMNGVYVLENNVLKEKIEAFGYHLETIGKALFGWGGEMIYWFDGKTCKSMEIPVKGKYT